MRVGKRFRAAEQKGGFAKQRRASVERRRDPAGGSAEPNPFDVTDSLRDVLLFHAKARRREEVLVHAETRRTRRSCAPAEAGAQAGEAVEALLRSATGPLPWIPFKVVL